MFYNFLDMLFDGLVDTSDSIWNDSNTANRFFTVTVVPTVLACGCSSKILPSGLYWIKVPQSSLTCLVTIENSPLNSQIQLKASPLQIIKKCKFVTETQKNQ